MSVLLSGDFHNGVSGEMKYITKSSLIKRYGRELFGEINWHVILGDGGFLWPGHKRREASNYETLSKRPFPVLCVFGNHDPVLGRRDLPEIDIGIGEKVILVNEKKPFLAYLKRGKVYRIENRKFLVMGGALSVDREDRTPGVSWWENEYCTKEEESELLALLEKENVFDYVLSHTGPYGINIKAFARTGVGHPLKFEDKAAEFNEKIDRKISCKQWFCGHWHQIFYFYDEEMKRGYQYLFYKPALIRDTEIIRPENTFYW
jgi:hypothetical protein